MAHRVGHPDVTTTGNAIERTRKYRAAPVSTEQPQSMPKKASTDITALRRPGHGTKGEPINLFVNWFRINFNHRSIMYIYVVRMTAKGKFGRPTVISEPETISKIFWTAVRKEEYRKIFPNLHRLVFDDFEFAYTPDIEGKDRGARLFCDHPEKKGVQVTVDFTTHRKFELTLSGDINTDENVQWTSIFLKCLSSQNSRCSPAVNASDREVDVSGRFALVNGGMFIVPRSPEQHHAYRVPDIQPGVDSWLGLYASVRRMENFNPVIHFGLMNKLFVQMNLDLVTFYRIIENESLTDMRKPVLDSARLCMSPIQAYNFNQKLKDIKLKCSCAPGKDKDGFVAGPVERHYRFLALNEDTCAARQKLSVEDRSAPSRFLKDIQVRGQTRELWKRWKDVPMVDWYAANGISLKYPNLPLCLVKSGKKEDLVPMEVLFTHDQPQKYVKMLNFYARLKITKLLVRSPVQHHKHTNDLVTKSLEYDKDPFMKAMDISLDPKMVECEGRVVAPCPIIAKAISDNSETKLELKDTGEFSISRAMEVSKKKIRFLVYKLTDAIDVQYLIQFYRELVRKCVNRGFDVPKSDHEKPPEWVNENIAIIRSDPGLISRFIQTHKDKFAQSGQTDDQLLVFLFITKMVDNLYGQIKYLCDIQHEVVSQVVDENTVRKAVSKFEGEAPSDYKSVFHHICLKLNAKLGGINHILAPASREPDEPEYGRMPANERTMFIGIDVIHPSPNSPIRDCSLAAIVASIDQNAAKYAVRIKVNWKCNENVQHFEHHFAALLQKYHEESFKYDEKGYLPERIVILRDGVSDSEMIKAASEELRSIKNSWNTTLSALDESWMKKELPPFTYIIVQKNHKTRFYRRPDEEGGKVSNPPMGTVVDKDAVTPHMFDFYMVSHNTLLGTTRPIHYTVVYDDCKSSADSIQEMLFRMCFLYARCSKPVSLPAPVYYAHLACERAAVQHEYAIKAEESKEILDRDAEKETLEAYGTRVQSQAKTIEDDLIVKNHPGMYFI